MEKLFYTVKELSEILSLSKYYINNAIKEGKLKAVNLSDRKDNNYKRLVSAKDLQNFIDNI